MEWKHLDLNDFIWQLGGSLGECVKEQKLVSFDNMKFLRDLVIKFPIQQTILSNSIYLVLFSRNWHTFGMPSSGMGVKFRILTNTITHLTLLGITFLRVWPMKHLYKFPQHTPVIRTLPPPHHPPPTYRPNPAPIPLPLQLGTEEGDVHLYYRSSEFENYSF